MLTVYVRYLNITLQRYILIACNPFHLTDCATSGSVVKKELLEKVAAGGTYKVNNQDHNQKALPPQTIVEAAEKWVGKRWSYRPLANNCETFASKMRYGIDNGFSEQVLLPQSKSSTFSFLFKVYRS